MYLWTNRSIPKIAGGVAGYPRSGGAGRGGPVFSPAHLWRQGETSPL